MLHDSHELDNIVSQFRNPREGVLGELLVRPDASFGRRDSDMPLVDTDTSRLGRGLVFGLIDLLGGWVPESSIVYGGDGEILSDATNPGRDPLSSFAGRKNERYLAWISKTGDLFSAVTEVDAEKLEDHLELGIVWNGTLSILRR